MSGESDVQSPREELRGEYQELCRRVEMAEIRVHVTEQELANYEEIDDVRRTLVEHLLVDKKRAEAEGFDRDFLTTEIARLRTEVETLEANRRDSPQGLDSVIADLQRQLDAARVHRQNIEQEADFIGEQHARTTIELESRRSELIQQIDEARGTIENTGRRWEIVAQADEARRQKLELQVAAASEELERSITDAGEVSALAKNIEEVGVDLDRQKETRSKQEVELARVHASIGRLRDKLNDAQRLFAMAAPEGSEDGASLDDVGTEPGFADAPPGGDDVASIVGSASPSGDAPDDLPTCEGDAPASADYDVEVPDLSPVLADDRLSQRNERKRDTRVKLDEGDFNGALRGGGRIVRTAAFHNVTLVNRLDVFISDMLEVAGTLAEIRTATPPGLHGAVAKRLFELYQRGLVDVEG